MLYLIQLLLKRFDILFIVPCNIGDGIFAGKHSMVLVDGATIDAVHTKELELVLAVEGNEVVMK
jgi:hypothetical protein